MSSRRRGGAVVAVTLPRSKAFSVRLILKCSSSPLCRSQLIYPNSLCSALTREAVSCLHLKNQSISLQVSLHDTPVKNRIDFKILLITFKAFHGPARCYWICSHPVSPAQHPPYMLLLPASFQKGDQAFSALIPPDLELNHQSQFFHLYRKASLE